MFYILIKNGWLKKMDSFATVIGYIVLGKVIPEDISVEFFNSSLDFKKPDHHIIYNTLKNSTNLNDILVRQLVLKILGVNYGNS